MGRAVLIGALSDHREWIAALVCLVVGVHFIPLARVFSLPRYRLTGAAMSAVAIATLAIGALSHLSQDAWVAIPALGAVLALWSTAASIVLEP